ncbi:MAG: SIMPL domain-containing protein [Pseudomonadota bacterium]
MLRKTLLLLTFTLGTAATAAEEAPRYDQVSFSVDAVQATPNDLLVAVMYAEAEGLDATPLAQQVNEAIAWALVAAKSRQEVDVQTLDYRTQPIYQDGRINGWRVSQSLRLQSGDGQVLSVLMGELQERLAMRSLDYRISSEKRGEVQETLIKKAIKAFRTRAEMVTTAFGGSGYRLVDVQVDTSGDRPIPRPYATRAMAMEAAAPPIEAGTQDLRVEVSGTIELR